MNPTAKDKPPHYLPVFEREGTRFVLLTPATICASEAEAWAAAAQAETSGLSAVGAFRFTGEVFVVVPGRRTDRVFVKGYLGPYITLILDGPMWEQGLAAGRAREAG